MELMQLEFNHPEIHINFSIQLFIQTIIDITICNNNKKKKSKARLRCLDQNES